MRELVLKKGRIEITKTNLESLGNAQTVRVIPDMDGLSDNPTYLPRYGGFFQENQRLYDNGDIVWIFCTEDYQVGYILGIAEPVGGSPISILITKINKAESQLGLDISDIRSADITCATDQYIDYVNKKYGHAGRIMTTGAIMVFGKDGSIYLSSKDSVLKLLADGTIRQDAKVIEQNAQNVKEVSSSHSLDTQGCIEKIAGSKQESIGTSLSQSIGGDAARVVTGNDSVTTFMKKKEVAGLGYKLQVIAPGCSLDFDVPFGFINLNSLFIQAPMGFATPFNGPGPFCTIPFCLLTGVPHSGRTFIGLPDPTKLAL